MTNGIIIASALSGAIVSAGIAGVVANIDDEPRYADVVSVEPITETVSTPRQQCYDEVQTSQATPKDPNRIAGTAIGVIVGGVIGNQVGGGNGKKLATAAGAAAGGYAGHHVQGQMQANDTVQTTTQRCETVYDEHQNVIGYDVSYSLDGEAGTLRMDEKPGAQILVNNGRVVEKEKNAG